MADANGDTEIEIKTLRKMVEQLTTENAHLKESTLLCPHPGCCCVCGHQGLCPEDGPSAVGLPEGENE